MIRHSTGNRKVLGSIPSGVEAFLFSQKNFSEKSAVVTAKLIFVIVKGLHHFAPPKYYAFS